ncbi:sensor histidine kinase [Actinopolymorpha pittospori]|uniref:histidine kinase n=1 Tax=Actinopolymorpha pittospori TaxID=648752 RepID=A0A927N087_9ACTN|nr:histidine kinase [Actinopolymorpha pittospori]MBE1607933.1 signal transduction histidine kinase [Actinopolymorpha pittospori]
MTDEARGDDSGGLRATGWLRVALLVGAVALTAILASSGAVFTSTNYRVVGYTAGFGTLFAFWQAAPVVIAIFRPLLAWCVLVPSFVVSLVVRPIDPSEPWPLLPTALIAYLVVQLAVSLRRSLLVAVPAWLLASAALVTLAVRHQPRVAPGPDITLFVLLSALMLVAGTSIRLVSQARNRLAEEEHLTAEERHRRRLLEERARIAREMHDIVAHHMSMIVVQASTAEYRLEGLNAAAKEEFTSISETARESLTEMRRLLKVLREEGTDPQRVPQPGLERIPSLVESTERAGTPVRLHLGQVPDRIPELIGLTAYRVVQESLSNVVRHASGAPTEVTVSAEDARLTVRIVNDAPKGKPAPVESTGAGHGLVGMRERVRLAAGELVAGPRPEGGFGVWASLPLAPASAGQSDGPSAGQTNGRSVGQLDGRSKGHA